VDSLEYRSSRTEEPFQVLIFNPESVPDFFWDFKRSVSIFIAKQK
jgi:hypothetical protein